MWSVFCCPDDVCLTTVFCWLPWGVVIDWCPTKVNDLVSPDCESTPATDSSFSRVTWASSLHRDQRTLSGTEPLMVSVLPSQFSVYNIARQSIPAKRRRMGIIAVMRLRTALLTVMYVSSLKGRHHVMADQQDQHRSTNCVLCLQTCFQICLPMWLPTEFSFWPYVWLSCVKMSAAFATLILVRWNSLQ